MIGLQLEEAVAPLIQAARAHAGAGHLTVPFDGRNDGWQNRIATAWAGVALVVQPPDDAAQRAKVLDVWRAPRDGGRFYGLYELGCRFAAIKDPTRAVEFAATTAASDTPTAQAVTGAPRKLPNGIIGTGPNGEYVSAPFQPGGGR